MAIAVPWPAVLSLVSTVGALYTLRRMWDYRDRPGARYWAGFISAIAVWTGSYGVGLLVFDPTLRRVLEVGVWVGKNYCAPTILGFALAYTGREEYASSRLMAANLGFWFVVSLVYAFNPAEIVWSGYGIDPVLGVATVSYTRQPLLYGFYALAYLQIGLAFALLFETLTQYGSLYRTQILAVGGGILAPWVTSMIWLLELGPVPQFNFSPIAFTLTVIATTFALFRAEMFEVAPPIVRHKTVEDLPDPFVAVDTAGNLVDFNPAARERIDGIDETQLGRPLAQVTPTLAARIDAEDHDTEVTIETETSEQQFDLNASPFRGPRNNEQGTQIILRDITALKERERTLQQRERELERQNERLDQFASMVSHDLRNPLGIARTYLDFARDSGAEADFDAVGESLERMDAMIDDLLTMARAETAVTETESVVLADLVETAWETVQTGDATLECEIAPTVTVEGDRSLLQNVFENLVRNAVEHNEPPVTVRVGTLADADGIYIEDDGSGIPPSERSDVFEYGHTTRESGTGFGLAIVAELVEAHGWEITVTDGTDGGARFEIRGIDPA